jgi:putative FmdB family regulatory protein
MPIFEYRCSDCNTKFEVLHKSHEKEEDIICPKCKSNKSKKLMSSFASSMDGNSSFSGGSYNDDSGPSYSGGCASGMCGLN